MKKFLSILLSLIILFSLQTSVYGADGEKDQACRKTPTCPDPTEQRFDVKIGKCIPRSCKETTGIIITTTTCQPQVDPIPKIEPAGTASCNFGLFPSSADAATCKCVSTRTPLSPAAPGDVTAVGCKKGDASCTTATGSNCTPGARSATTTGPGIMTAIGCIPTEPRALIAGVLKYGSALAGSVAFLLMILGALQMITAEGNPESIKHGQERFYSAIIGLLLVIFAVLLMQVIGVDILNLPGFSNRI